MDRALIEQYAAGASRPALAIRGLTVEELNAFPVPGTWSIQQIVLHLMDSDLIASDRMKRVIAENKPTIIGYDEAAFSKKLFYERLDAAMACEVFRLNRLLTATILRSLPNEAFARTGTHSERGVVTLEHFVETYTEHVEYHLKFLRDKRRMLGKPLDELK
jgi:hypothetical protein